ncbi:MAG: tetratricopeptide repeat protein [Caldilineaceae bacterium]
MLRLDGQGGVYLLPAVRDVIVHDLAIETRQQLHQQAAAILQQRGEITEAAWHLLAADQPEQAVALWFPQREEEIQRGAAAAALAIFEQVSQHRLTGKSRQQLALVRAELYQLLGEPDKTSATLSESQWPADSELAIDAARLWGDALDATGRSDAALERYEEGAQRLNALLNQGAQLYVQRGLLQLRQREMEEARRNANLARFHAERLLGAVADQQGDFQQALVHYQSALSIAEALKHEPSLAQIHHYLGILTGRHQRMEVALPYFEAAMQHYEHIGDRLTREYVR